MACTVTITDRPEYLHVVVTGDNTPETLQTYTTEVPQACMKFRKLRVLVVVRLTGPELSMMDVYKGVSTGSDGAVGLGMRIAYLDENPDHSMDNMLLAEDVGRSRGIAVKTFRDEQNAERWLLTDDPE
jgi:hypothetical protein